MIISFTAGSATDIVGRVVSAKLAEFWGSRWSPRTAPAPAADRLRAGGQGRARRLHAADQFERHSVNPAIYAKLPYDTTKDFVDIVPLSMAPNVLVVNAASPYKSLMDLVGRQGEARRDQFRACRRGQRHPPQHREADRRGGR